MSEPKRRVSYNYLPKQFPPVNYTFGENDITSRVLARISDVAERGDFTLGAEVEEFEGVWANAVGTDYAIGMSNGTDAIAIALEAAGFEAGEEVVTSPVSFIATSGAIIQAGGKPVFVDVEMPQAPNITPSALSAEMMKEAKWFVPVMWAGNPYGFDQWSLTTECHVVVDAAQAVNAKHDDKPLGAWSNIDALAYSLHPLKNINVWGDGGMIGTNQRGVDYAARLLRNHGLVGRDIWDRPGYNSRLSTVQAAVGLEVIKDLDFMNDNRQANASLLIEGIEQIDGIVPPYVAPNQTHGWHLFQIIVEEQSERSKLVKFLNDHGVEAKVHYDTPLHLQPAVKALGYTEGEFPNAEIFCANNVTLPIHEYLEALDVEYMLDVLRMWSELGS